jgi:hypothetical protein
MLMSIFVLAFILTPAFGHLAIELFSDDQCTQPYSEFLTSNYMINDISDWNNGSIVPDSVIAPNRQAPSFCVPRTIANHTQNLNGWSNFFCTDATSTENGYLRIYEYWNVTSANCSDYGTIRLIWRANPPAGSTYNTCVRGSLLTNWANNTYTRNNDNEWFDFWVKMSCSGNTSNGAVTDMLNLNVITLTIVVSLAILNI